MDRAVPGGQGLVEARIEEPRPGDIAAALLSRADGSGRPLSETTPDEDDPSVASFCESLGVGPAAFVEVEPIEGATPNGCHHAVARAAAAGRGVPVFGVTFWRTAWREHGLFLTAESHALLGTASGALRDVTPKSDGETRICFAADRRLGPDFDFLRRAANAHRRIYVPSADEIAARVRGSLACMPGKVLKSSEGRAARVGMSVEAWIASRLPPDPLAAAIDAVIAGAEAAEALLVPTRGGLVCRDEQAFARATERKMKAYRRMMDEARRRWG